MLTDWNANRSCQNMLPRPLPVIGTVSLSRSIFLMTSLRHLLTKVGDEVEAKLGKKILERCLSV